MSVKALKHIHVCKLIKGYTHTNTYFQKHLVDLLCEIMFVPIHRGVGWLVGFYAISTFVGHLTPNPFLCK